MVRRRLLFLLLLTVAIPIFASARNFLLVLEDEDSIAFEDDGFSAESSSSSSSIITEDSDSGDWDDDEEFSETGLSPEQESWKLIEEGVIQDNTSVIHSLFFNGLKAMIRSASEGNPNLIKESIEDLQLSANGGNPHAQSALGLLHGAGIGVDKRDAKAFLYHYFAAQGGSYQSKMVMAYNYFRQQMYEKSVKLYAEVASVAIASLFSSKESPLVEPIRIYDGTEENTEGLRKSRGEDDDDFQILEYQAQKGNAGAMAKLGVFYYFGLRGVQRDHSKALFWFLKAAEKGQYECMEFIGEIYAGGIGVEKNYTRALAWFKGAVKRKQYSAYNGIGYLYAKGHGVEKKNFTRARECFKRAADSGDPNGHYNLGVVYLKGLGVKRDVRFACKRFVHAANNGQPKAFYQLAKMFQKGIGVKRDLASSAFLYKLVAERGPWGSMLRWALECYLKGQIGKALLLYSRAAELGYEIAQSNAAWILDKYGEYDICIGKSGFCDIEERHQRSRAFWWRASEQGNEHAALLIGDAYYYGRGTDRDFERAAEAYLHAHSQANAQAMFNLGYMYEHGEGLPHDLHMAKRYYDQALETDPSAKLPVTFALFSLWLRRNYADTFMVKTLDSLPDFFSNFGVWLRDEGNLTLVALFVCLSTVLYLRQRHRNNFTQVTEQAEVVDN